MRIASLNVDGYGIWTGLRLDGLADDLNVFCGPNEAGKSTLVQFIRSVLYGFSPERQRYLPPLRGGRPGGSLEVASPNGRFDVSRHADDTPTPDGAQAVLTAADGTRQGQHLLKMLLCDVDEAVFNNVFAVGLREMQELGTLSDTEAASLLYNLSVGLDRVSLVEVMQELETSRNHLLHSNGQSGQLLQLLAQREQIRSEIEDLSKLTGQYARLSASRDQLDAEAARLEEEKNEIEHRCRVVELAMTLADRWRERKALDNQLSALNPPPPLPDGALDRLDRLNAQVRKHRNRAQRLRQRYDQLRTQAAELPIRQALWRQTARIQALQEQTAWIESLKSRIAELETDLAGKQSQLAAQREQLGLPHGGEDVLSTLPSLTPRVLASFRQPARALRGARDRLAEARAKMAAEDQTARSLGEQIDAALQTRGGSDLPAVIERAGALAAQLRRQLQLDQRLEQMDRYQEDLNQQSRTLLARQLLPVWVLLGLGAVFVVGFVLIMAGLFMPASLTGSIGWALALLGLGGAVMAGLTKFMLERSNARQLDACQKQINMLQLQAKQAREERDTLQRQLPSGVPIASQLQAAEAELAALEQLLPLDARRRTAQQEATAAKARLAEAEQELAAARTHWREALSHASLPEHFSPKQLHQLAGRSDQIEQLVRQIRRDQEELDQRRRELDAIGQRITQLAAEAEATVAADPLEQLRALAAELAAQEARVQQRDALHHRARRLRRKLTKRQAATARLKYHRRVLLERAGAESEEEFRRRALAHAHAETLRRQRAALQAEIDATIGGQCSEQAIAEQLAGELGADLEARRQNLNERAHAREAELAHLFEKRGALGEQLRTLAEDRRMPAKQLELALLDQRLRQSIRRWQVLATTRLLLDQIRDTYERQRQPETLQEASGYLERMTRGRYRRVWTPLGENVLRVDDAEGRPLPADVLSRGTREQLFLSLRLALVSGYARRGAQLPLILDDVLVNFDLDRARAAGTVLRDFAGAGHQLLVFTCHEHILKLFKSLKVGVHQLPDSAAPDAIPTPATTKPRRRSPAKPLPRELVADAEPHWDNDGQNDREEEEAEIEAEEDSETSARLFDEDSDDIEAA